LRDPTQLIKNEMMVGPRSECPNG